MHAVDGRKATGGFLYHVTIWVTIAAGPPSSRSMVKKKSLNPLPKLLSDPQFLIAAHSVSQWPVDQGAEVAFAGRSNVGKSSAINAITQRRALARTSRTPGRTQQIVFFELPGERRIVDLPGYGFARVPAGLRQHWRAIIERYLTERIALKGLIMVMDSRHPLTELDRQLLSWCTSAGLPVYILLTKIDKLRRNQALSAVRLVRQVTDKMSDVVVQPFSAVDFSGVNEARDRLVDWLGQGIDQEIDQEI